VEAPDPPGRLDLPGEPLAEVRSARVRRMNELDRDHPATRRLAQEDLAHAAGA